MRAPYGSKAGCSCELSALLAMAGHELPSSMAGHAGELLPSRSRSTLMCASDVCASSCANASTCAAK